MAEKARNEPHAKRKGWLRNGNSPGDPRSAPRCGAKTRAGSACKAPAMKNGRCRMHGGKSTGPRTSEGKKNSSKSSYKHGEYTTESLEQKKKERAFFEECKKHLLSVSETN